MPRAQDALERPTCNGGLRPAVSFRAMAMHPLLARVIHRRAMTIQRKKLRSYSLPD
jgi:hypothetical protein